MRKTVIEYVREHSVATPDKIAVIVGEWRVTYRELFDYADSLASYLAGQGLQRGDVVVVRSAQTLNFVVTYLAVHLAGGVITSTEKSASDETVLSIAKSVGARMIISDDSRIVNGTGYLFCNLQEVTEHLSSPRGEYTFPREEDSADILFTTGTTGQSKGVELSHKALTATAENLIYGCGYTKDIVLIVPGPLNHANPIRKLFTTLVNGSTIYILDGMANIRKFYEALDYPCERVACCLPPAFIRLIFQLTKDKIGDYADKIDFIESASAPLPESDKLRLCRLLPRTRLYNNYGSSESASVCMYDYNAHPGLVGCIGRAMPNAKIMIVDENKNVIASSKDRMGYLACAGDVNMKGYVNEPELTREVLVDGILYTNDVGYIDTDGFIYIIGRKSDVINVGGLKVAPAEVEAAALANDAIDDCICIGVEHPITGRALKLLYVSRETLDKQEMMRFLAGKLESYKVPQLFEKVERVERTYNGKLNRKYYQ